MVDSVCNVFFFNLGEQQVIMFCRRTPNSRCGTHFARSKIRKRYELHSKIAPLNVGRANNTELVLITV